MQEHRPEPVGARAQSLLTKALRQSPYLVAPCLFALVAGSSLPSCTA
jgi:hypothetical protein